MPSTDAEEATGADDQPKYMETTSVTEVQCLEELTRLLQNCLESDVEETPLENQDPFLALKNAELLAESIAERLAPKRSSLATRHDEAQLSIPWAPTALS